MSTELTRKEKATPETVREAQWLRPAVDVYENEAEWLIQADVPGITRDALRLHLDKDELVIEGSRNGSRDGWAGYRRIFALPRGVDGTKVSAELEFGVVTVHLPKSEAVKPRVITVKAG